MNTNIITAEERRTYEKVRKAIREEKREDALSRMIQKIIGLVLIALSIIEMALAITGFIDEGGLFIFAIPVGVYVLLTKENVMETE